MTEPTSFKTPSGDEMVIIPRADYEALIEAAADAAEDAADAAIYAERKAALAAGDDAVLPAEVSALIGKGDSRIKAIRKWRKLGQVQAADNAAITQGYWSDLENGRRTLPDGMAERLARVLDVPASWLKN